MRRVRAVSRTSFLPGSGAGSNFLPILFISSRSPKENEAVVRDNPSIIVPGGVTRYSLSARNMFDEMPDISTFHIYMSRGEESKAFLHLSVLKRYGLKTDEKILSSFVNLCSRASIIGHGMAFHCITLKQGFHDDFSIAENLAFMYSKCGKIADTFQLLKGKSSRGSFILNSTISRFFHSNMTREAINIFSHTLGTFPNNSNFLNNFTFSSIFKTCARSGSIRIGKIVHGLALKLTLKWDVVMTGSLMDMYSKLGCLEKALCIFKDIRFRDLISWNSIISGCIENSQEEEAFSFFRRMQVEGFCPNEVTFSSMLKASSELEAVNLGRCFHSNVIKHGHLSDSFVGTALVSMYSKCMCIEAAEGSFMDIQSKNLVSFNALLSGYGLIGGFSKAMEIYVSLLHEGIGPDEFTLTSLMSSCSSEAFIEGIQVHCHAIKLGIDSHTSLGNSLVGFYAKCGIVDSCIRSFGSIIRPNSVSWAGIISSLVKNDEGERAMCYFKTMLLSQGIPDEFSVSAVLKVSSDWSATEQGKHLHALAIKLGQETAVFVATGLVDMYCKSGIIDDALEMFDSMPVRNDTAWNVMINGLGHNGRCASSIEFFHKMVEFGVRPNALTFNAVLSACCHAGLVNEGRFYFNLMSSWYGILPSMEHRTCMIRLLVCSGFLHGSELLTKARSCMPNLAADGSLLGSSYYVFLSNLLAEGGFWTEVADVRGLMREMYIRKEVGCSWITTRDETRVFSVGYKSWFPDLMKNILLLVHKDINACL